MKNRFKTFSGLLLPAFGILLITCFTNFDKPEPADTVRTEAGLVSGVKGASGAITSFKGIPFAAPPVGDLRWKAPQPAKHWEGVRKCVDFGPSPMQPKPTPFAVYTSEFLIPEKPISEDCLYLNVWTKTAEKAKKPVLVWIYGGGFSSGGTAVPIYDGEAIAKKGVVFVSVNYRVGVFGFFSHPELTKEAPYHASGNYGLLDQIAALKWIKHNIAAFGGDPENVTIAGQSAGSMSVNSLVASPLAKGLFQKAIAESGSNLAPNPLLPPTTLKIAEEQNEKMTASLNLNTLQQLRALTAEEAMDKLKGRYSPIVDGHVLPETIPQIFAQGKQNNVAVITGWNADENFVPVFKNKEDFTKDAEKQYGADAPNFLKYFPAATDEEAKQSQIYLARNNTFATSGYKWAIIQSKQGKAPIYVYYFEHKVPATAEYVKYGAFHTAEVAYVLNDLKFLNRPLQPADFKLADLMSSYWVNFAKSGNPNGAGLPEWPKFNAGETRVMIFNEKSASGNLPGKGGLDFLLSKMP